MPYFWKDLLFFFFYPMHSLSLFLDLSFFIIFTFSILLCIWVCVGFCDLYLFFFFCRAEKARKKEALVGRFTDCTIEHPTLCVRQALPLLLTYPYSIHNRIVIVEHSLRRAALTPLLILLLTYTDLRVLSPYLLYYTLYGVSLSYKVDFRQLNSSRVKNRKRLRSYSTTALHLSAE